MGNSYAKNIGEIYMRRICAALSLAIASLNAQTPAPPPLAFEVASVKPAGTLDPMAIQSGKMRVGMKIDGAMVDIASFSLKDLIRTAYEVKDYQITGPDWLGTPMSAPRFNIQATIPEGATKDQVPQMLQTLLADRFKLVVHRENKDHAVYALVVAKSGLKLKESDPDPATAANPSDAPPEPKKGEMVMGQGSSQVRVSGSMDGKKGVTVAGGPMGQMHMSMVDGKMHMEASKMDMPTLAEFATRFVDRPVVDMTELKGTYKVALDLSMDDLKNVARAAGMGAMMGEAGKPSTEASEPSGSSIFTSMQQMGLRLEARKAPLPVIVVDHLEKTPTEN
jgi:uncharacterized protein (TIGR03435 family)